MLITMLIEKDKVSLFYMLFNEDVLITSSKMTDINKPPKDLNSVTEELNTKPGQDGDKLEAMLSHVGEMGRYQIYLFFATLPFGLTFCFNYFVPILITVTPENYWCRIPELKNLSQELRRNLSSPGASTGEWNQCMTFDTNWTQVLHTLTSPPLGTSLVPCQYGWEFDFSVIPYETVVTERGWVCEQETYPRIAMLLSFVGSVVGCCLFGWIADRYGRIPALIGANLISGIGGVASIFTTGVWDFHVCRFLVGMSYDSCYMIIYVLVLEYVGPKYRTLVANLSYALSFGVGATLVPWAAYFIADWRNLIWITTLPGFLVLLTPWLLPESAKWLISKGRVNEAVMILKRVKSINRTKIPDHVIEEFMASCGEVQLEKKYPIAKVFKSKPLCRALAGLAILFFGYAIVFDGLLRVTDSYGMNLFTILTAAAVCEFLAVTLIAFTLDRLGRRNCVAILMFTSGTFLLSCPFVPKGHTRGILSIIGRFFMNFCSMSTNQWAIEILPTPLRASGSSILHMSAYAAIFMTPFISYLERVWTILPMLIFPVAAFTIVIVSLTLPETKGLVLPQTVTDSEKLIRNNSLCRKPEDSTEYGYLRCFRRRR